MNILRRYIFLVLALILITECHKHKKKVSLAGEDPVEVGDFIDFFPLAYLPFQLADTSLQRKEKDSMLIGYKVFTQFVPDSVLSNLFGKNSKAKLWSLGKIQGAAGDTYLFVKAIAGERRAALVLGFDKKKKYIDAMPALQPDLNAATSQSFAMDKRYTFTKTILRKNGDGSLSEGKDVYLLNGEARKFMLIMTDALDDRPTEMINPIDTLARKNKFSADYVAGKMNMVSIRDGRKNDRLRFFIHFEKNKGDCSGELKGEAMIVSANSAIYKEEGGSCELKFTFTPSTVTLKEDEGCGSHRGLRCSFDGSYPRKKIPRMNLKINKSKTK